MKAIEFQLAKDSYSRYLEGGFWITQQTEQDASAESKNQDLESEVSALRSEVWELRSEISTLRSNVSSIENYLKNSNQGVSTSILFLIGFFCALWAQNTGRNAWLWFFFGMLLSPISLLVLLSKNANDRRQ